MRDKYLVCRYGYFSYYDEFVTIKDALKFIRNNLMRYEIIKLCKLGRVYLWREGERVRDEMRNIN